MKRPISRPRGMVSVADALIALDGLSAEEREIAWGWLPELIGVQRPEDRTEDKPATTPPGEALERRRAALRDQLEREERAGQEGPTPLATDRQRQHPLASQATTLPCRLQPRSSADPDWLEDASAPLGDAREFRFQGAAELLPLFEPRRTRSILSSALATQQADGDLDIDALLDQVTRRRSIERLPRHRIATTRLGLQLLLDRSASMTPYLRDQLVLAKAIRDTVGADRIEELRFETTPGHGVGPTGRSTWRQSHRSPPAGTPVVLLTDLGLGERDTGQAAETRAAWREFAHRQRRAGCPLLAVLPCAAERVPEDLRREFQLLPWSRTTTVATVRQWIGRGLKTG